jgi:hypothetical protein
MARILKTDGMYRMHGREGLCRKLSYRVIGAKTG